MRWFINILSVVIAMIAVQMVVAIVVVLLYMPYISHLPRCVSVSIFVINAAVAILVGILSFKKVLKYLRKELLND
jgi:hypothetical protein